MNIKVLFFTVCFLVSNVCAQESQNVVDALKNAEYVSDISINSKSDVKLFDKNFKNIPIVGELVEIYEGQPGSFYYRRIGLDENPTKSAFKNALQKVIVPKQDEEQTVGSYKEVSETGITKTNAEGANAEGSYGKYYDTQENIHRLKLYEGDKIIQSRFGQSIRFSGYNNGDGEDRKFAPTIILIDLRGELLCTYAFR